MHLKKLGILLLVVGGLVALALWQRGLDERSQSEAGAALLPGFDRSRVRAVRVENLERSLTLRIERVPGKEWRIVDPVDFPAEMAVVEVLLDALSTQHARPAPDADPDKLSLNPPRVIVKVEEDVGGSVLQRQVEIGAIDLGDQWVYARVDGKIFRTERGLDSTLERDLPDWRSRFVLTLSPRQVIEVHRTGSILYSPEDPEEDLTFAALLDGHWTATLPFQAELSDGAMERLLVAAATLRAHGFVDAPGPLAGYGLDPARIRVELQQADGKREVLLLAKEPLGELWYAAREGSPNVFRVAPESVLAIAPPTPTLIEREVVKAPLEAVQSFDLRFGTRTTTLERVERGWRVRAKDGAQETLSGDVADSQLVADALGLLDRARVDDFAFGKSLAASDVQAGFVVRTVDDEQVGEFGPIVRTADGVEALLFRRTGDALTSYVTTELLELCQRAPDTWRSLDLHKVPEIELARIELASGPAQKVYARDDKGRWLRMGTTLEAKEFAKLVDGLVTARALEIYRRADEAPTDLITVRLVRYSGTVQEYQLGRWKTPQGENVPVYRTGERFARVKPELHAALVALLSAE